MPLEVRNEETVRSGNRWRALVSEGEESLGTARQIPIRSSSALSPGRRAVVFAVVSVALLMSTLDQTIVATALHALQHGLGASITWAGWTITIYSLGLVLTLSLAGQLTERFGQRRVFLTSVAVFSMASLCCGLAGNIYVLVALRFVQAVGGAGFTPSATRIVVEHFGEARDKAVGLFGSFFTTGALIGPLLGGIIVAYWSWRGVFLVNVPIGAALFVLCWRYVPADRPRATGRSGRLDLPGVGLLGVGLLAAMIGLTYLGDTPPGWVWPFVAVLTVATLSLSAFAWHIHRTRNPLIAPRLIHGRGFGAVNMVNILYGGAGIGLVALIPLYAVTRYDIGALGSGTLLAAEGAGAIIMSTVGAFVLRRTGYRLPLYWAAVIIAIGMLALAATPVGLPPYGWVAAVAGLVGLGLGWSSPASRNAGLQLVPEQAASLAALRSTGMQVGSIAAISVATAVIADSAAPGTTQAWIYVCYAAVLIFCGIPATARIPEHRGSW
ncbi:EmrB/QacA subfamily drug resistance transporter [Antricoccus suffuscus]|uniref:EmrB/QacA subfamily drug resistance transporter n=1 Tax=Antricoccus suffuscus TaxID=1629062 RepID=A0A2T0ZY07_9ACTN|nr:MFS transporter [Antricoccus suffuscus]PRZ41241.1 EmrB/QacA subfamily drug resistance transporter [Antricoccus suffuscus]